VCQYMNLTKAAEKLHISQPALSAVIKQIENECGVALFRHRANSIAITDEGIVLQQEIEPIIKQYQRLEALLTEHKLDRNYIRIGLSTFRGNSVMPDLAARFRQKYPDIQLLITEGGTRYHYENLDLNKLDLIITDRKPGFSAEDWEHSPLYGHVKLKQQQMVFAVSVDNPLARQNEVGWDQVVKESLILLDNTYNQTRNIAQHMVQDGYQIPGNAYYTSQIYTVICFVEKNAAAGFLPIDVAKDNPKMKGLLFPASVTHSIYLVWRKDRHLYHAAKMFVDTAKELYAAQSTVKE
ncbi:MAG: LysR family transcriptional regulator, partial [Clostridia bacterium]|nr:LysR family transcriptional regulator [Clostridia bacterium]